MTSKTVPSLSSYHGLTAANNQLVVPTADYFRQAAIETAQEQIRVSRHNSSPLRNKPAERKWRLYLNQVIGAYQQSDYRQVNRVVYAAMQDSDLVQHDVGQFYDRSELMHTHRSEYMRVMRKVIEQKFDATPYVSEIGSASAAVAATLGISGVTKRADLLFFSLMLAAVVLIMGYIYTRDEQSDMHELARVTPQTRFKQVLIRAVLPIVVLNVLVITAVVLSVALVALFAHLPIGYVAMPYAFGSNGALVVRTVVGYLAYFLIYFNLWTVILVVVCALTGRITKNVLMTVFIVGTLTFLTPLGLLNVFGKLGRYIPFAYSDFYEVYFGLGQYAHVSLTQIVGVFLTAIVAITMVDYLLFTRQK
ncbi:hypothetical protein [Lacticaseibacillus sharpeae]|nr:hypothetical protein [Lacticaseibacillus sharpeae]